MSDPQVETAEPNDCPFCRSSDLSMSGGIGRHFWIYCAQCSAGGPDAKTRLEAIKLWNEPTDDMDGLEYNEKMIRKNCERLRKELDEATGTIR